MIIMIFCIKITMMVLIMTISMLFLMKKIKKINTIKQFKCGFNTISSKRLPFSKLGMMFLIFDIEIIIIMPIILTLKFSIFKYWLVSSKMMTIILLTGIFHEWKNGMLKWTN